MKYKGKTLTDEQDFTVECVESGDDTKVQAPAGSGKTFVLEAAASQMNSKKGIYLAFNKAIADDAGMKFPGSVECRTGHSVAFRNVGWKYKHRFSKITGSLLANTIDIGDAGILPTIATKGYLVLDTLRNFCYSDVQEITTRHVPKLKCMEDITQLEETRREAVKYAKIVWKMMKDEEGRIPITHDFYLKLWALSDPIIHKDYILFDEAQDANPVMLGIVNEQEHAQKIFVGDRFQQIYGWRGATNAMSTIRTPHECFITQSFRFGPAIADMANSILHSYMPPELRPPLIKGLPGKEGSIVTKPLSYDNIDAIICRTNGGVVSQVFQCLEAGIPIYIQGGVNQMVSLLKGAEDLQAGRKTFVPDLALFKNWEEVVEYANSESGGDMKSIINLISAHGIQKLMTALYQTCQNKYEAKITLTTAHKAKGLEWNNVQLYNDFQCPEVGQTLRQEEINILYVAATRALNTLDISGCPACDADIMKIAERHTH